MTKEKQLAALIDQLEQSMKLLDRWQTESPTEEALQSLQPFALDTLTPEEWLQWIFIEKLRAILKQSQPVPCGFSLSPYFEECWKQQPDLMPIITILQQIDKECR